MTKKTKKINDCQYYCEHEIQENPFLSTPHTQNKEINSFVLVRRFNSPQNFSKNIIKNRNEEEIVAMAFIQQLADIIFIIIYMINCCSILKEEGEDKEEMDIEREICYFNQFEIIFHSQQ